MLQGYSWFETQLSKQDVFVRGGELRSGRRLMHGWVDLLEKVPRLGNAKTLIRHAALALASNRRFVPMRHFLPFFP